MLLTDKVRNVLVDGSAHDLLPMLTGGINEVLRVEHVVDFGAISSCSSIHLRLLSEARSLHHHWLRDGLCSRLHHDLTRRHWLLEHGLPLDLRHLHHIPTLILVPPVSILVPPLILCLLGLDSSVDWLLELCTIGLLSTPLKVLIVLEPKLAHYQSKRSDQGDEVRVLGTEDTELMLLVRLFVHLLLEVEPSLLFRLTESSIEMTAFEEHLTGSLLRSTC